MKIRIVVDMHGGTVESVCTDSDVELDVVFLEEPKQIAGQDGRGEDDCYEVEGGLFEGQAIYTHYDGTKVEASDIDPVFAKAEKRLEELE